MKFTPVSGAQKGFSQNCAPGKPIGNRCRFRGPLEKSPHSWLATSQKKQCLATPMPMVILLALCFFFQRCDVRGQNLPDVHALRVCSRPSEFQGIQVTDKGDTIQAAASSRFRGTDPFLAHPSEPKRQVVFAPKQLPPRPARPRTTVLAFGASRARRAQRAQADFAELAPRRIWSGTWGPLRHGKRGAG